jgi:hypothetical protein
LEVAEVYYGLAVTNGSHALQMTLLSDPLSFVYQLPSGALPDKHSIATLSFTSIARGTFRDSGHAGLALWHPEGRFIFHTNYQDSEKKVIYAGHGTDGVLRQLRWDPQTGTFIEKAPYLLTTHAENSPLQHLESLSLASLGTLLTPGVFQIPIYQICQARATIALCDWLLASNKSLQSVRDLFVFAPTAVSQSGSDDSDDAGDPKEQAHMILAAHWRALSGGDLPFSIQQAAGTAVIDVVQTYPDLGAIRDALGDLKKRSIGDIQTQIGALQAGASPVLKFELSFMHSTS